MPSFFSPLFAFGLVVLLFFYIYIFFEVSSAVGERRAFGSGCPFRLCRWALSAGASVGDHRPLAHSRTCCTIDFQYLFVSCFFWFSSPVCGRCRRPRGSHALPLCCAAGGASASAGGANRTGRERTRKSIGRSHSLLFFFVMCVFFSQKTGARSCLWAPPHCCGRPAALRQPPVPLCLFLPQFSHLPLRPALYSRCRAPTGDRRVTPGNSGWKKRERVLARPCLMTDLGRFSQRHRGKTRSAHSVVCAFSTSSLQARPTTRGEIEARWGKRDARARKSWWRAWPPATGPL